MLGTGRNRRSCRGVFGRALFRVEMGQEPEEAFSKPCGGEVAKDDQLFLKHLEECMASHPPDGSSVPNSLDYKPCQCAVSSTWIVSLSPEN